MRCFYCKNLNNNYAELDRTEQKHLFSVLRAKEDNRILLIDGRGGIAEGRIEDNKKISIVSLRQLPAPRTKIHLYVSTPRRQKMDLLLSQCTEAGAWEIHPMFTEYSVALPKKETTIKSRWQLILIEACKQSHNPFVPNIHPSISFNSAVKNAVDSDITAFYGSTAGNNNYIAHRPAVAETAWFVGPEGGFSEKEEETMIKAGFQAVSIGRWIMRVETAAVIGTALLQTKF